MGQAERDQCQAVKHPRDLHAIVADGETEALPVPINREPGIKNPGARDHDRGLAGGPPKIHGG